MLTVSVSPDVLVVAGAFLALIWGVSWAVYLQRTTTGRYLVRRQTWLTVVIGVGADLLIALLVLPLDAWLRLAGIFALSAVGIIARSLRNESREHDAEMDAVRPELQ